MSKTFFLPLTAPAISTRRDFLNRSLLATAIAAASAPPLLRGQNLNSRVAIAGIGVGGKGASDLKGIAEAGADIVALCDVDEGTLNKAAALYPKAKLHRDYRKMYEQQKDFDGVSVSTPDHHHAPAAAMGMLLGKGAYVQKPLAHSVWEARRLGEIAKEKKVATLMGNQGHSGNDVRNFCELIWAGAIGKVREAHIWTNRPIWPQGRNRPAGEDPVPATLNWDVFLGPAPLRPFKASWPDEDTKDGKKRRGGNVYHPFAWRGWWDFGTGALGDMACHLMDPAFWALHLGHADSVEAVSEGATSEMAPKACVITYQFPARKTEHGDLPPVKIVWYDGGKKPTNELLGLAADAKSPDNGSLFIGETGKMTCETYGGAPKFAPDSKTKEFAKPAQTLARSPGHHKEFVEAIQGKVLKGMASLDYAGPFTEMVLMGNLAVRTGKKVEWDGPKMKAKNMDVSKLVKRDYRAGWTF